jgi:hypothetical protein
MCLPAPSRKRNRADTRLVLNDHQHLFDLRPRAHLARPLLLQRQQRRDNPRRRAATRRRSRRCPRRRRRGFLRSGLARIPIWRRRLCLLLTASISTGRRLRWMAVTLCRLGIRVSDNGCAKVYLPTYLTTYLSPQATSHLVLPMYLAQQALPK